MSANAGRGRLWVVVGLLVAAAAGAGVWWWQRPKGGNGERDPVAALEANNRGIGHIEWFEQGGGFFKAVDAFDEAVRLDPDWLPARINLAIALFNSQDKDNIARARQVLDEVLKRDPDNLHAHYTLGMIDLHDARIADAHARFETVLKHDPGDAHAWFHKGLTHPAGQFSPESKECFEKALALNPNLTAARYRVAQHPHQRDPARSERLLAEHTQLMEKAEWFEPAAIKYTEMGKYADVIGRTDRNDSPPTDKLPVFEKVEKFRARLAGGAAWTADLGKDETGQLRQAVRDRFGATVVLLDYNRDGKPDVFLLGAVAEGGKVRDLLLKNDGEGQFTDVTAEAGLAGPRASLGCAAADFDNDGHTDLFVSGAGGQKLFRNSGSGRFEDVTEKAGLDKLTAVCLGSAWVDLDQDGDLDLVIARYADDVAGALRQLREGKQTAGGLSVWLNVGEAPAVKPGAPPAPLTCRFRLADGPEGLLVKGPVVGVAVSDVDNDRDVDLVVLRDGDRPRVIYNDRLLRFHQGTAEQAPVGRWTGALVLDLDQDERSELLLTATNDPWCAITWDAREGRAMSDTEQTPIRQAQAIDLDRDGRTDAVCLLGGAAAVLHSDRKGSLTLRKGVFGAETDLPADAIGLATADFDGDGEPDLLLWSAREGPQLRRGLGNGNHSLRLALAGLRDKGPSLRTNADGIGARASVLAGRTFAGVENTTLQAGLGQSRLPLELGLGRAARADVVRIRWPDGIVQAELEVASGATGAARITETNRKGSSCPVLLAWDGRRFGFVTDILGAGTVGEMGSDASVRPARPEESVKIEPGQLVPRDGHYLIKIAEPMDEVLYLDRLRLIVCDHPPDVAVYPDERFVFEGPQPTQELLALGEPVYPVKARDHRGRDVTETLRRRDRRYHDSFDLRSWLGYAEEHQVELDFGDRLSRFKPGDRLMLCLAGWTDYPFPEAILAATQAGVPLVPPVLERQQGNGWKTLGELGFPAGLPRVMTREVSGLVSGDRCVLRFRTNMQVYFDEVYIAPVLSPSKVWSTPLEVAGATLEARGFMQEVTPDGRGPIAYDDDRTEPVPVTRWRGRLTRTGDVTELLRETDDRFVLCGPGDEVTVRFDARNLPPLPEGWRRSFVLRSWGFCKDTSPLTVTGGEVEPLPWRAMKTFPPAEKEPDRTEYRRRWNTRPAGQR